MISFTDITESVWHIRNTIKQKATTERKTYKDFVFVKTCQRLVKATTKTCLPLIWQKKSIHQSSHRCYIKTIKIYSLLQLQQTSRRSITKQTNC